MKKQDGIPSDASTEAKEHTDNFAEDRGSYWFSREQFLEMYNKHYRRHPLRKLFKRRYVEKPLDVMKYVIVHGACNATIL